MLLGFGLTALFAFATNWTRARVENQLVEDVMNSNIDECARASSSDDPATIPRSRRSRCAPSSIGADRFEALRDRAAGLV